jgi:hypothetical protein
MSQYSEGRLHSAPASPTTWGEDTNEVGYPRCEACGQRAPTEQFLARHRIRRCPGLLGAGPLLRRARRWRTQ